MEDCSNLLKVLKTSKTTAGELQSLRRLKKTLQPLADPSTHQEGIPQSDLSLDVKSDCFLSAVKPIDVNDIFNIGSPASVFILQKDLDVFVHYVFDRRFGWSEAGENGGIQQLKKTLVSSDAKYKSQINDILDDFLLWFLREGLQKPMLLSLSYTITQAGSKPVVRNQTVIHLMDWLKAKLENTENDLFIAVKEAVLLGLTDVWSAIRNACVSRLSYVLEGFTLSQVQSFFSELIQVCRDPDSSWQSKEGAVMGIGTVIRKFQWIGTLPDDLSSVDDDSDTNEYYLKFGCEELHAIPEFISCEMRDIIYKMLAHPQLSIRENAIKAYSTYISRCELQESVSALDDVIRHLCPGTKLLNDCKPHLLLLEPGFQFLDPYEAEGLLGVCVHLVKHLPSSCLLPRWPLYSSTFTLYLTHPASTVRQVTSSIFKFLVAKDSSNPELLRLVLQGLSEDWNPDISTLTQSYEMSLNPDKWQAVSHDKKSNAGRQNRRTTIAKVVENCGKTHRLSEAWEWREGRLLTYELILQFLIKNHWLYTFGSSQLGPTPSSPRGNADSPRGAATLNQGSSNRLGRSMNEAMYSRLSRSPGHASSVDVKPTHPHRSLRATTSLGMDASEQQSVINPSQTSPKFPDKSPKPAELFSLEEEEGAFFRPRTSSLSSNPLSPAWDIPTPVSDDDEIMGKEVISRLTRPRYSICTTSPLLEVSPLHNVPFYHRTTTQGGNVVAENAFISKGHIRHMTLTSFGSPTTRALSRHYSYYKPSGRQSSSQTANSLGAPHNFSAKASSLLMHALNSEKTSKSLGPGGSSCPNDIPVLSSLLSRILHQTIESIADSRWEIRRMGQQLLPYVVEVLRWYDMRLLQSLWDEQISHQTTLLTYGALLALKYSLVHAARLNTLLQEPPSSWQDVELCRGVVMQITECIQHSISRWVSPTLQLLQRPCWDRLTVVAMETLMVMTCHFKVENKKELQGAILGSLRQLFSVAHHGCSLVTPPTLTLSQFVTPMEGWLSCITRPDRNTVNMAKQVERYLLSEIQHSLLGYVKSHHLELLSASFPLLVYYTGEFSEDDQLSKSLMDCLTVLSKKCAAHPGLASGSQSADVYSHCISAIKQMAALFNVKALDLQSLRQVVELYIQLAAVLPSSEHTTHLLQALATRTCQAPELQQSVCWASTGHLETDTDLLLRSNDIPAAADPEDPISSEEEEEDALESKALPESQLLNVSGNSSGTSSHHRLSLTGTTQQGAAPDSHSQDGSDWDDWDEEEAEDNSAINTLFMELIKTLQKQDQAKTGNNKEWMSTLAKLSAREHKQISHLL